MEDYNINFIDELNKLKTPCYIIDKDKFKKNLNEISIPFNKMWNNNLIFGYSIKTNHSIGLLNIAKEYDMYAEAVSDDEYLLARQVGYKPNKIIFNGPQKSEKYLLEALNNSSIVNIDNIDELILLEKNRDSLNDECIKLGLRINFDLEEKRPGETTAGDEVSRFGICVENGDFEKAINILKKIDIPLNGLHMHYSSSSRSLGIFRELAKEAAYIIDKYNLTELQYIDIGGGFFGGQELIGKPQMIEYATEITNELIKVVDPQEVKLILEPGASIIATAVNYLSKVINVRDIRGVSIITVDGSNIHINPFLSKREPTYKVFTKNKVNKEVQIICGSTCMENDRIVKLKDTLKIEKKDLLYCYNAGAYTMGFNSCFINLPPYVYLKENSTYKLIRDKNKDIMMEI